mgnify:CR=1 FL=1
MKLGLVQQANSSDRAANIEKLKQNIGRFAGVA